MTEAEIPCSKPSPDEGNQPKAGGNPLTDEFGQFVKGLLEEWKVPGLSIAVIDGDQVYTDGYGFATLPETPATPDTLWYGGSTTKAQVAAAIAHLIDSGKYPALSKGWATPISSIIHDDFVLQDEWATKNLTLEDAVCHRTGMPRHDVATARERDGKKTTPRDTVRSLRHLPLTMQPRTQMSYNNLMFITLSHVVETLTGKWLGDVLKETIWEPLGMNSTYFDLDHAKRAQNHLATGYYWDEATKTYKETPFMETHDLSGAGGILSTATNFAKWVQCLLNEAEPFSEKTHKDIQTARIITAPAKSPFELETYGLGWQRVVFKGHAVYNHSGGVLAYGAQVYWVPDIKFGVVAFSNTSGTSNVIQDVAVWRLIQDKLGEPAEGRFDAGERWRERLKFFTSKAHGGLDQLYPDRTTPPIPSALDTSKLAGSYYHPAYGTMVFREAPHPDKPDEKILITDREDMTWRYRLSLHHVSGDHWISYKSVPSSPSIFTAGAYRCKFNIGPHGEVASLEIDWYDILFGASEGTATLERVP
ncbi:D-aminopeptidase [Paramyrothecium foliicola]|nr:D-aminopeptidase [Paramyrothecium foliicola]